MAVWTNRAVEGCRSLGALLLLDGFTYNEIAAIVAITPSNVGVKINRIKSALAGRHAKEAQ